MPRILAQNPPCHRDRAENDTTKPLNRVGRAGLPGDDRPERIFAGSWQTPAADIFKTLPSNHAAKSDI